MAQIDILMACYNGERYINEQIDSIFAQTYTDWHLLIRDDGSTDRTVEIINDYIAKNPGKITLIDDDKGNLGPKGNFYYLFETADAPYFSFSDQDDLWRPNKLQLAYEKMCDLAETENVDSTPLMVFADREIIDSDNNLLSASYWARQGLHPKNFHGLLSLLPKCVAAGSTMLINKKLRDMSLPVPKEAIMHDTWVELIASAFGRWEYNDEVVLSYRRHDANVSGGQQSFKESRNILSRAMKLFGSLKIQKNVYRENYIQAKVFYDRFEQQLEPDLRKDVQRFLSIHSSNPFHRAWLRFAKGFGPHGWERKLTFCLLSRVA